MGRLPTPTPEDARATGATGTSSVRPQVAVIRSGNRSARWNLDHVSHFDNPSYVSDAEKRLMLCDPQLQALLQIRRTAVLMDGVQIIPQEGIGEDDPRWEKSRELCKFLIWNFVNMSDSFHGRLLELLHADWWRFVATDNVLREQTWGKYKGKLTLDEMRTLPRGSYAVVVDDFGRIIGLQDATNSAGEPKVYPISKFAFNIFRPEPGLPLGTDLAAAVRTPWFMKNQCHGDHLKHLALFASPTVIAFGPETDYAKSIPLLGPDNKPIPKYDENNVQIGIWEVPIEEQMNGALAQLQNASAITLPPTSKAQFLEAQGDGRIWTNAMDAFDWQMAVGILGTGNMQMRQKYGSNATAQTGKETVDIPIFSDKTSMADLIKKQICKPLVEYNFPESYWDCLPSVMLGDPRQDFWERMVTTVLNHSPFVDAGMVQDIARRAGVKEPSGKVLAKPAGTVPGSEPSTQAKAIAAQTLLEVKAHQEEL